MLQCGLFDPVPPLSIILAGTGRKLACGLLTFWESEMLIYHVPDLMIVFQVVVEGKYKFQVQVRDFDDPVDDCGGGADRCVLYIDDMCLSPLPEPGSEEGGEDEECSLGERSSDIDIESGLPRTVSINSDTTQPWPVS